MTGHGKGNLARRCVTVCEGFNGEATVLLDGCELPVRLLADGEEPLPSQTGRVCGFACTAGRQSRARG